MKEIHVTEQEILEAEQARLAKEKQTKRPNRLIGKGPSRIDKLLYNELGSKREILNFYVDLLRKLGTVEEAQTRFTGKDPIKQATLEADNLHNFVRGLGEEDINALLLTVVNNRVQAIGNIIREHNPNVFIPNLSDDIEAAQKLDKENTKNIRKR
ncbi:MAG: hypothetical protein HYX61_11235 [Gammaproteobacteria bacterium]|jgi:hypothetical protein|nr:hypothetical protein [Gammaproteobacteria bacterium]